MPANRASSLPKRVGSVKSRPRLLTPCRAPVSVLAPLLLPFSDRVVMRRMSAARWLCLAACLAPTQVAAQLGDASVLPRGHVAVSVGGTSTHYTGARRERFQAGLDSARVPALATLATGLNRFFAATDSAGATPFRASPADVTLGGVQNGYTADRTVLPVGLALGLTSRLTVHAGVSFDRRSAAGGGIFPSAALGLNTDTAGNRALLATLGIEYAQLGGSRLLPTEGSTVGAELQRRVRARTGRDLNLPRTAVADTVLRNLFTAFGLPTTFPAEPPENLGPSDVEVGARFQFSNAVPRVAEPETFGRGYRGTFGIAARLPIGRAPPAELLDLPWISGAAAFEAQLFNDIFWSERVWSTISVRGGITAARDVRRAALVDEEAVVGIYAETVEQRESSSRVSVEVAPRYRLTPSLTLAAQYVLAAQGEQQYTSGVVPAAIGHAVGAGVSFSTLPLLPRRVVPFEVTLGVFRTVAGAFAATAVHIEGRTVGRLWGARQSATPAESSAGTR